MSDLGHVGDRLLDHGQSKLLCDVLSIEKDSRPALADHRVKLKRVDKRFQRRAVQDGDFPSNCSKSHGTIHEPGVEKSAAQSLGQLAAHRRFAGRYGAVDGYGTRTPHLCRPATLPVDSARLKLVTRRLSLPARVVLILAAAYCFTFFVALHARATDAFFQFVWPVAPPTAAFIGAWFGAMAVALLIGAFMPGWAEVRSLLAGLGVAAGFLILAALVDDEFREDEFVLGIAWYAGLLGILIASSIIALYQELLVESSAPADELANLWLRRAFLILAMMIWFFGLLLTIAPGVLEPRWPWRCLFPGDCIGALPERDTVAIGAVLLGTALPYGWAAVDGGRRAMNIAAIFGFLAGSISMYGMFRFSEYVDESYWSWLGIFCFQLAIILLSVTALALNWWEGRRDYAEVDTTSTVTAG